eukprot:UN28126
MHLPIIKSLRKSGNKFIVVFKVWCERNECRLGRSGVRPGS